MQVACNSCGAQYEFDSSAIPAEGYDAQCTSCSAIFFVAPESSGNTNTGAGPAPEGPQVSVSCSHCGAIYQFAAADIPAGGYDAQCTQCQGIFFVSPDAAGPSVVTNPNADFSGLTQPALTYSSHSQVLPTPQEPIQTILTGEYSIPETTQTAVRVPGSPGPGSGPRALDSGTMELQIPPPSQTTNGAYVPPAAFNGTQTSVDLQASHGGDQHAQSGSFEVPGTLAPGQTLASAGASPAVSQQPAITPESAFAQAGFPQTGAEPASALAHVPAPSHADDQPFDEVSGIMEITDSGQGLSESGVGATLPPGGYDNSDDHDAMGNDYASDLGKPMRGWTSSSNAAMVASDIDMEDDPGTRGRAKPLFKAIGVLAVLGIAAFVAVKGVPQALQSHPAQPALKPPSDAAKAAFARGQKSMLEDTAEGYKSAGAAFTEAVNMSPDYVEALSWASVAQTLLGDDKLFAGRVAWQFARDKNAEAHSLAAATATAGKMKPRDVAEVQAHVQQLQRTAQAAQQKATDLLESGGKALSDGEILLLRARRLDGHDPMIAEAQAIWYVSQPAGAAAATQELARADSLRHQPAPDPAQAPPPVPAPWFHQLTQARLAAMETTTESQAVATLRQLAEKQPQVVRARWELADTLSHSGQKNEARDVAQQILATVPTHAKAQALLQSLGTAAPVETVVSSAPDATPDGELAPPPIAKSGKQKSKGKAKHGRKH